VLECRQQHNERFLLHHSRVTGEAGVYGLLFNLPLHRHNAWICLVVEFIFPSLAESLRSSAYDH
jgi:hypothetical protein